MPTLTRWFLKTALLCLSATLLVAVLLSTGRIWTLPARLLDWDRFISIYLWWVG